MCSAWFAGLGFRASSKKEMDMAELIRDVMTSNPVMMPESASALDAAKKMRDANIGDVIVMKEGDKMCGIVTDRDIVVRALAEGKDVKSVKLGDICTQNMATLSANDDIETAVKLMRKKAIRRIPVVENGKVIGIVSIGDLAMDRDPQSALGEISAQPPNN
jgi:CBS domain-containing protein